MRFYNPQLQPFVSQFVPDTTNWDLMFRAAKEQKDETDKTSAIVDSIDTLKLKGGFSTGNAATKYNEGMDFYQGKAQEALLNHNSNLAVQYISKAKKLAYGPEAIKIREDETFEKANPNYLNKINSEDNNAIVPFATKTEGLHIPNQVGYDELGKLDVNTHYGYTPTGKGYLTDYAKEAANIATQFDEAKLEHGVTTKQDANGDIIVNPKTGEPIYYSTTTGNTVEGKTSTFLKNIIAGYVDSGVLPSSGTKSWDEATIKRPLTREEHIDKIYNAFKGMEYTKNNPSYKESMIRGTGNGSGGKKPQETNYPKPADVPDPQHTIKAGEYNSIDDVSIAPKSYDEAKKFHKTFDIKRAIPQILEKYGITPTGKEIKDGVVFDAAYLESKGATPEVIDAYLKDVKDKEFEINKYKNNLELSMEYANTEAKNSMKGVTLSTDANGVVIPKELKYEQYDDINRKVKNTILIEEAQVGSGFSTFNPMMIRTYDNPKLQEIKDEYTKVDEQYPDGISSLAFAGIKGGLLKGPGIVASMVATRKGLDAVFEKKYNDERTKQLTDIEIAKHDPAYGAFIKKRDEILSKSYEVPSTTLNTYTTHDFGKIDGEPMALGESIKNNITVNPENYTYYYGTGEEVKNTDFIETDINTGTKHLKVSTKPGVIVTDPYNKRILMQMFTSEPDVDKKGNMPTKIVYVDITNQAKAGVGKGLLQQSFFDDFYYMSKIADEVKYLPIGRGKEATDIPFNYFNPTTEETEELNFPKGTTIRHIGKDQYGWKLPGLPEKISTRQVLLNNINDAKKAITEEQDNISGGGRVGESQKVQRTYPQ